MSLNSWLCLSGPFCWVLYLEKHLWVVFSHWISCPSHKDSDMSRETAHAPAAWYFPAWTSKTWVCAGGSQELQERHFKLAVECFDLGLNYFQESLNHQRYHIYNKTKFKNSRQGYWECGDVFISMKGVESHLPVDGFSWMCSPHFTACRN